MKRLLTCVGIAIATFTLAFGQRSLDAVTWLTYKSGTTCNIVGPSTKVIRSSKRLRFLLAATNREARRFRTT